MSALSHFLSNPNLIFQDIFDEIAPVKKSNAWSPRADLSEEENSYVVKAELPGVEKNNIKVTLENKVLTISGEKKLAAENEDKHFHRSEFHFGQFQRKFYLAKDIDSENIEAELKNGILEIRLNKTSNQQAKEISVKS